MAVLAQRIGEDKGPPVIKWSWMAVHADMPPIDSDLRLSEGQPFHRFFILKDQLRVKLVCSQKPKSHRSVHHRFPRAVAVFEPKLSGAIRLG